MTPNDEFAKAAMQTYMQILVELDMLLILLGI